MFRMYGCLPIKTVHIRRVIQLSIPQLHSMELLQLYLHAILLCQLDNIKYESIKLRCRDKISQHFIFTLNSLERLNNETDLFLHQLVQYIPDRHLNRLQYLKALYLNDLQ